MGAWRKSRRVTSASNAMDGKAVGCSVQLDALVVTLRAQADEIASDGHAGWGNTMTLAADTLERLQSDMGSASTDLALPTASGKDRIHDR